MLDHRQRRPGMLYGENTTLPAPPKAVVAGSAQGGPWPPPQGMAAEAGEAGEEGDARCATDRWAVAGLPRPRLRPRRDQKWQQKHREDLLFIPLIVGRRRPEHLRQARREREVALERGAVGEQRLRGVDRSRGDTDEVGERRSGASAAASGDGSRCGAGVAVAHVDRPARRIGAGGRARELVHEAALEARPRRPGRTSAPSPRTARAGRRPTQNRRSTWASTAPSTSRASSVAAPRPVRRRVLRHAELIDLARRRRTAPAPRRARASSACSSISYGELELAGGLAAGERGLDRRRQALRLAPPRARSRPCDELRQHLARRTAPATRRCARGGCGPACRTKITWSTPAAS